MIKAPATSGVNSASCRAWAGSSAGQQISLKQVAMNKKVIRFLIFADISPYKEIFLSKIEFECGKMH
jgi:hypothetical protein